MKDVTKKVIILNNFSSPHISEAIIVLKDYNPKLEGRIIDEAEKIVSDYLDKKVTRHRTYRPKQYKTKNKPHITLSVLFSLCVVAIIGLVYYFTN